MSDSPIGKKGLAIDESDDIITSKRSESKASHVIDVVTSLAHMIVCIKRKLLIGQMSNFDLSAFIWGLMIGIVMTTIFVENHVIFHNLIQWKKINQQMISEDQIRKDFQISIDDNIPKFEEQTSIKGKIYFGVLTAKKYLNSRAAAVHQTWGQEVDQIEFFVGDAGGDDVRTPDPDLPVVYLKDTDDGEYPPQKKMFHMLQHICENHVDNYEWFARADDDLYVRYHQLRLLLTSIDSDRKVYMGQPGKGIPEMRESLGLDGHNFCMGGPGVLINRLALKDLCPHLDQCQSDVVSNEEDVELGRCVTQHLHIECTNTWETLKLFYHSYSTHYTEDRPFQGNLPENEFLDSAVTLHYLKLPHIMYSVHRYFQVLRHHHLDQKLTNLTNELTNRADDVITALRPPSVFAKPNQIDEWQTVTMTSLLSTSRAHFITDLIGDVLVDIKQVGERSIDEAVLIDQSSSFIYNHVINAYVTCAIGGCSYLVDVLFVGDSPQKFQVRRVETQRVLMTSPESSHFVATSKSSRDDTYFVVVATDNEKSRDFEAFMRDVFDSSIPRHQVFFIAVPVMTSSQDDDVTKREPPISEVADWLKVKHPDGHLEALPSETSYDDAYRAGIARSLQLNDEKSMTSSSILLLTSSNTRFDGELLIKCSRLTSSGEKPLFYQPLSLASSKSSWNLHPPHLVAPLCGHLHHFSMLLKEDSLSTSLYNNFYSSKIDIFRVPDVSIFTPTT